MGETAAGAFGFQPEIGVKGLSRKCIRSIVVDVERQISYRQSHLQEHFFVERLHLKNGLHIIFWTWSTFILWTWSNE